MPESLIESLFTNLKNSELVRYVYLLDISPLLPCCVHTYNSSIVPESFEALKNVFIESFKNQHIWQQERQFRVTCSRCYSLFTYKGADWSSKIIKYFWPKKFTNRYIEHGIEQEIIARETYENLFGVEVYKLGFLIMPSHPWIGYSADGVVFCGNQPQTLIEIKCPFLGKICV